MNHFNHMEISNDSNADNDLDNGPSTSLFTMEDLKNTPSRRANISEDEENKKRRDSIKMIREISEEMNFNKRTTISTAFVYFHRFYMFHSMIEYPPRIAVLGCLFLAGKVEETPKKCKDLLSVAQARYPAIYDKDSINDVMNFEKILLHTLRFDLQVEHPYSPLLDFVKVFQMNDVEKKHVCSYAWAFIYDSYFTTLCLQWEPEVIAVALMQMAINMALEHKLLLEFKYNDQAIYKKWWNHFIDDIHPNTIEIIEQIIQKSYNESENDDRETKKA